MREILQQEIELFDCIRASTRKNLALVSTEINGVETACISWISKQGRDYTIQPLAILVNDAIFPMLHSP